MKKTPVNIELNISSIVHGTPNSSVFKLNLIEKFSLLKHFNNKHLLNKKLEFVSVDMKLKW